MFADMQQPAQKCARRDHHRSSRNRKTIISFYSAYGFAIHRHFVYGRLLQLKVLRPLQPRFHSELIRFLVALDSWRTNRRALCPVQHPKLNSRSVGIEPHRPAKRVDLADNMPFGQSADRRIARHLANRVQVLGQKQRPASQSRRR